MTAAHGTAAPDAPVESRRLVRRVEDLTPEERAVWEDRRRAYQERRLAIESDGADLSRLLRRAVPEAKRWWWARRHGWTRARWDRGEDEAHEQWAEDEAMRQRGE
jgi:hypothetical protein